MLTSTDSSLVLASCTFAFSASWRDLFFAFIIEYSAVRAFARAPQASLAESAQATEINPSPMPNTALTAIDWLLVMASPRLRAGEPTNRRGVSDGEIQAVKTGAA